MSIPRDYVPKTRTMVAENLGERFQEKRAGASELSYYRHP